MDIESQLQQTIDDMVDAHRGILAADESLPTMEKRFRPIGVESTEETRRAWRSLLVTTPGLGDYISGIILFEETLYQTTDNGTPIPEAAWKQKIVPGVKVDKGQASLRSRERFWDIRVPKIDSIFDNSLVPRPSWSPGVPPQHRKLVAATHRSPI